MANTNLIFKIVTALPATKTPHTVYMVYNSGSPTSAKFCMTDSSGNVVLNTVSQDDVTQAIAGIPAQTVSWGSITEKPAVIAAGTDAATARAAIGAGTLNDAPNDGSSYVRKSAGWKKAPIIDGGSSPNLLFNGGFELMGLGWNIGAGTIGFNTLWGNVWSHVVTSAATTGSISSDRFPVIAGGTYTVTGDSLMTGDSGSGSVYFDLIFYNNASQVVLDGAQKAVSTNHDFSPETQRDAHRIAQVAPATATSASARFVWTSVSVGANIGCRLITVHGGNAEIVAPYSNEATLQKLVPQQGGYLSGELRSDYANNYRIRHPNGSTFWRNDGANFYLLKTASGDADGGWDATRPFVLNLATGVLNINGNAATANTAGNVTGIVAVANGGTGRSTSHEAYLANKSSRQQHLNGSQTTYYLSAGIEYSVFSPFENPVFVGVLPDNPAVGDEIVFLNGWNTWITGRFSIMRGSPNHSINGVTDSIVFDTNDVRLVRLTYVWSNIWVLTLE